MKKVIKFIKNNILGFLVGLSLCLNGVVIAENIITANQVTYKNSTVESELDSLFDAVDINERLGNTNEISEIGNGTVSGAIGTLNTNLLEKQAIITGGATTILNSNLEANRALISNVSGKVAVSGITSTELGYLSGVTSNIQTQINTLNTNLTNKSFENKKAHGYLADLDNLDKSKNYYGLVTMSSTDGRQGMFIQFGGSYAIQIIFFNATTDIMWRIAYPSHTWSDRSWTTK